MSESQEASTAIDEAGADNVMVLKMNLCVTFNST